MEERKDGFYDNPENQRQENSDRSTKWNELRRNKELNILPVRQTIIKVGTYNYKTNEKQKIRRQDRNKTEKSYEDKVNEVLESFDNIQNNINKTIEKENKTKDIMNQNYNQSDVNDIVKTQQILNQSKGQNAVDHIIDDEER